MEELKDSKKEGDPSRVQERYWREREEQGCFCNTSCRLWLQKEGASFIRLTPGGPGMDCHICPWGREVPWRGNGSPACH